MRRITDDDWQIDACPHNGGGIAANGQGLLHLTWFTNGSKRQGLFYKYIDGDRESQPLAIGNPANQASHATIAAMGDTVILTWREFDGQSYLVQMIRSNDGGNSWGEPQRLMETSGAADYPIPLISSKQLLVVWNTATEGLRVLTLDRISTVNNSGV